MNKKKRRRTIKIPATTGTISFEDALKAVKKAKCSNEITVRANRLAGGGTYTIEDWIYWAIQQMRRAARTLDLCEVGATLPEDNFYSKGLDMCADTGERLLKKIKK